MKRLLIAAALGATAITGIATAQTQTQQQNARGMRGMAAADRNGDGVITRAEATAAADAMFARMDKNRDGKLSADERPGRRGAAAGEITQQQFRDHAMKRFDRMDTNKDGRIDQTERNAMRANRGEHRRGGMRHGGVITKAEATAAAAAMFDRLDTNKDGRIDQAEREAARGQMKGMRGAPRAN